MKILLFILCFFAFSKEGKTCSCLPLGDIDDKQYEQYQLIAVGKVLQLKEEGFGRSIKIHVESYYKGKTNSDTITIQSPQDQGLCGLSIKTGEMWLFFGYWDGKEYYTNLCTRTKNLNPHSAFYNRDAIKKDIAFLERKRKVS